MGRSKGFLYINGDFVFARAHRGEADSGAIGVRDTPRRAADVIVHRRR